MAESDTILQLGIEAAREGNREEARNLFGLLTRQEPNNAQAWLWLAGVAEGPDQRRAALERVVELDPTNEMAIKGLQAMGVRPNTGTAPAADAPPPVASVPDREMTDEERYAQELDSAFDDYDALPRAETPPRADIDDTLAAESRRTPSRGTARERSAARRSTTPIRSSDDDDDYLRADTPRRGLSPLMLGLLGLIVAVLLCVVLYPFATRLLGGSGGSAASATATALAVAGVPTLGPTSALPNAGGIGGTDNLTPTVDITGTGSISSTTPISSTAPVTPTGVTEAPAATAVAPPAGGAPSANPNLQAVAIGEQLQANGWTYTFPNAGYILPLGNQVGSSTAQGTYLHVLVWVANNTGNATPLPPNFFALKDASNNVYNAVPQVSSIAVQRGVNADVGMEDAVPANGVLTSMYLVFDVPPGAQGLTLFASGNNGQGWPLNIVP